MKTATKILALVTLLFGLNTGAAYTSASDPSEDCKIACENSGKTCEELGEKCTKEEIQKVFAVVAKEIARELELAEEDKTEKEEETE